VAVVGDICSVLSGIFSIGGWILCRAELSRHMLVWGNDQQTFLLRDGREGTRSRCIEPDALATPFTPRDVKHEGKTNAQSLIGAMTLHISPPTCVFCLRSVLPKHRFSAERKS
jgi:hypothetical protein